jgi:hypothetical protein
MFHDPILKKLYERFHITADRLVCDPVLMQRLTTEYVARTGHHVEPIELSQHLLNLRKRGEAKGGLARLSRNYTGRRITRKRIVF